MFQNLKNGGYVSVGQAYVGKTFSFFVDTSDVLYLEGWWCIPRVQNIFLQEMSNSNYLNETAKKKIESLKPNDDTREISKTINDVFNDTKGRAMANNTVRGYHGSRRICKGMVEHGKLESLDPVPLFDPEQQQAIRQLLKQFTNTCTEEIKNVARHLCCLNVYKTQIFGSKDEHMNQTFGRIVTIRTHFKGLTSSNLIAHQCAIFPNNQMFLPQLLHATSRDIEHLSKNWFIGSQEFNLALQDNIAIFQPFSMFLRHHIFEQECYQWIIRKITAPHQPYSNKLNQAMAQIPFDKIIPEQAAQLPSTKIVSIKQKNKDKERLQEIENTSSKTKTHFLSPQLLYQYNQELNQIHEQNSKVLQLQNASMSSMNDSQAPGPDSQLEYASMLSMNDSQAPGPDSQLEYAPMSCINDSILEEKTEEKEQIDEESLALERLQYLANEVQLNEKRWSQQHQNSVYELYKEIAKLGYSEEDTSKKLQIDTLNDILKNFTIVKLTANNNKQQQQRIKKMKISYPLLSQNQKIILDQTKYENFIDALDKLANVNKNTALKFKDNKEMTRTIKTIWIYSNFLKMGLTPGCKEGFQRRNPKLVNSVFEGKAPDKSSRSKYVDKRKMFYWMESAWRLQCWKILLHIPSFARIRSGSFRRQASENNKSGKSGYYDPYPRFGTRTSWRKLDMQHYINWIEQYEQMDDSDERKITLDKLGFNNGSNST